MKVKVKQFSPRPPRARRRAGHGFTILELLIVLGVLSTLLAIILPTIKTIRTATLKRRAALEATALVQAAIRYKMEYGIWPGQAVTRGSDEIHVRMNPSLPDQQMHPVLISRNGDTSLTLNFTTDNPDIQIAYVDQGEYSNAVFRAFARARQNNTTITPNPLNPKGIEFLSLEHEGDFERVTFNDPWGNPYVLFMGLNPNSTFTHDYQINYNNVSRNYRTVVSNTICFAYSRGTVNTPNYIYSAGVGGTK